MSQTKFEDFPKSLKDPAAIKLKISKLNLPYMAPLTQFVYNLRNEIKFEVPYFDPDDGGIEAICLFLLQSPGPKANSSGFISRNNPDESAKNFFLLNKEAGLPRKLTITWNIVPWYTGSRKVSSVEISKGIKHLEQLLSLINIKVIVLLGGDAQKANRLVANKFPNIKIILSPHPSPLFINNKPGNWQRALAPLQSVISYLNL